MNYFLRGRGRDVKRELPPVQIFQQLHQQTDVRLQTDPLAHFIKVLAPYAPEVRVMQQQIGKLSALLNEMNFRETVDSLKKVGDAKHVAEDNAGIVKTQGLIEIADQKISACCFLCVRHNVCFLGWLSDGGHSSTDAIEYSRLHYLA